MEPAVLPSFIQPDPTIVELDQRRQKMVRDLRMKEVRQSPAEQRVGISVAAEPVIRRNLQRIDKDAHPQAYRDTQLQLAEALAGQGEFTEAAKMATRAGDDVLAAEYRALSAAVSADDTKTCNCNIEQISVKNAQGVTRPVDVPRIFVRGEVFSKRHGRVVPVLACSKCSWVNATRVQHVEHDVSHIEGR